MKKVYVYDLNVPSGLRSFYNEAREKGIKINYVENLMEIEPNAEIVIINPRSTLTEDWGEIERYIKENKGKKIFFDVPDLSRAETERLIGSHENVNYLFTKESFEVATADSSKRLLEELAK